MTAREAFDAVSNGGLKDLEAVLAICRRQGGCCVIDGLAVNSYVRPVYTMDADIVIAADKLPHVRAELLAAGFAVHEETWSLNAQKTGSELRIQFTRDLRYQPFIARAVPAKVLGCDAWLPHWVTSSWARFSPGAIRSGAFRNGRRTRPT